MKKKNYDAPWFEVQHFTLKDVIMASIPETAGDAYNDANGGDDIGAVTDIR